MSEFLNTINIFNRNLPWTQSNLQGYNTKLSEEDENKFKDWYSKTAPKMKWDSPMDDPYSPYDYRGWFLENKNNPGLYNIEGHLTDKYKTPYHSSFSNESIYAKQNAPRWKKSKRGWNLVDEKGNVLAVDDGS